jgi:hypothetical protein
MGAQSRAKRLNREAADVEALRMRLRGPGGPALLDQIAARPEIAAAHAAALADEGLQARWREDLPGQRRRLTRAGYRRAFEGTDGAGGWMHPRTRLKLLHSVNRETDGNLWGHLSLSYYQSDALAGWPEMRDANRLLYPGLTGVQVIVPAAEHVNIGEVLHVWTCLTADVIPDFGRFGTI